ncbi:MAG: glycosyltransferase [Bacteroidota bacterium]
MPSNFNIQKILIAPLDWGLGHATRCIPIIRALIANGFTVVIAAEGAQAHLLQTEFPTLQLLLLPGYRVRYSKRKWTLPFTLLAQLPRLLRTIKMEAAWLKQVIDDHQIDLVISDNRYGLSNQKVSCIFITHQLTIKAPFAWLETLLQKINYRYINRFTACWVPDMAGAHNLAGCLSHPAKMPAVPVQYIGLLSRFRPEAAVVKYEYCILLSGPEPQRTLLEDKLLPELQKMQTPVLLVRGKPGNTDILFAGDQVTIKNHLPGNELQQAILQSEYIVSRSGYTTVMELMALQKKSILIPTPGQTEQEYLAQRLAENGFCITASQDHFDCVEQLLKAKQFQYQVPAFELFEEAAIVSLIKTAVKAL